MYSPVIVLADAGVEPFAVVVECIDAFLAENTVSALFLSAEEGREDRTIYGYGGAVLTHKWSTGNKILCLGECPDNQ